LETAALPFELLAYESDSMRRSAVRLFGLLVLGVFAAATAEFAERELLLHRALVLGGGVVALLADTTFQVDD
jgi:hypothetical protein